MLEIVLLILKIAGIIIVSVLGILLVMVCLVLFVPVKYRGELSVSDAEKDGEKTVSARFRAAWLLHLVRVSVSYEETVRVRVKILFFTLMDTAKEKKRKKTEPKKEETSAGEIESGKSDDGSRAVEEEISTGKAEYERAKDESQAGEGTGEKQGKPQRQKEPEISRNQRREEESDREKKGIRAIISKILQTIRDFCDKLKRIREKAERAEELWISDHMVNSRSLLGRQLVYLLKHTKPKKLAGYIRFGFDDPSTTGYAMAVYGILYPIWSPKLSVEPDFERKLLDCHILLKGKMRVWHFVRTALRLFFSKDVRRVIKDVKKL